MANDKSIKVGRRPIRISETQQHILNDCILPGAADQRLPGERALAERYGVSRPTVRGALERLEAEDFITRVPKSGYFIRERTHARTAFIGKQIGISFARGCGLFTSAAYLPVLDGIYNELHRPQFTLAIPATDYRWSTPSSTGLYLKQSIILGMLLIDRHDPEVLQALIKLKKPMVSIDADATQAGIDSFCFENQEAGAQLARRLRLLGHRHIAAIFESPERPKEKQDETWSARRDGFRKQWASASGPPAEMIWMEGKRNQFDPALHRLHELLNKPKGQRPTAVVLPRSDMLQYIRKLVAKHRLKIPQDISVVGFGSAHEESELTAIRFDASEMGGKAATHLVSRLHWKKKSATAPILRHVKGRYAAGTTHGHAPFR